MATFTDVQSRQVETCGATMGAVNVLHLAMSRPDFVNVLHLTMSRPDFVNVLHLTMSRPDFAGVMNVSRHHCDGILLYISGFVYRPIVKWHHGEPLGPPAQAKIQSSR